MRKVHIVNYGMGNIKSVQRGVEHAGGEGLVCADPDLIRKADRVVLPGVGAFGDGMQGLREAGMLEALSEFVGTGKPLLGICLGMQMLFDRSKEFGTHQGLGFVPGGIEKIFNRSAKKQTRKIPHVAWSALLVPDGRTSFQQTFLKKTKPGSFVYFTHSYVAHPNSKESLVAQCNYSGALLTAAVQYENVFGVQFHPEKSGESGISVLASFIYS